MCPATRLSHLSCSILLGARLLYLQIIPTNIPHVPLSLQSSPCQARSVSSASCPKPTAITCLTRPSAMLEALISFCCYALIHSCYAFLPFLDPFPLPAGYEKDLSFFPDYNSRINIYSSPIQDPRGGGVSEHLQACTATTREHAAAAGRLGSNMPPSSATEGRDHPLVHSLTHNSAQTCTNGPCKGMLLLSHYALHARHACRALIATLLSPLAYAPQARSDSETPCHTPAVYHLAGWHWGRCPSVWGCSHGPNLPLHGTGGHWRACDHMPLWGAGEPEVLLLRKGQRLQWGGE